MEGGRDDYLFWMNAQNIFFQLPKLNKYYLGAELAAAAPGDKKAPNGSSVGLHAIPLHDAMATECDKKKTNKKGMPVTEILNTCTRQRDKDLLEI